MAERKIEFSGITAPLPAGSFDVQELAKALEKPAANDDVAVREQQINKVIEDQLQPVPVAYQDDAVKPQIVGDLVFIPDGHELKEVEVDGEKRTLAVPVAAKEGDDPDANANRVSGGATALNSGLTGGAPADAVATEPTSRRSTSRPTGDKD